MLIVETIARIRRAHFVQGKPIKAICRELKISRKVVRKVLRSGETAFEYERTVQPMPKIGPYKDELDRILAGNETKATRERLTLIRVFEELRSLGYDGGYDAVRRYAQGWRRDQVSSSAAAFVPLSFAPGEAYQFDSHGERMVKNRFPLACSFPSLFRHPWSEPFLQHGRVSLAGANSHTVAVRNSCTLIPLTLRLRLRRTGPYWSTAV